MTRRKSILPKGTKSDPNFSFRKKKVVTQYGTQYTMIHSTWKKMKYFQNTTHHLIPKLPLARLVRELLQKDGRAEKIQAIALESLHEAAESYLVSLFSASGLAARHAKRITVKPTDIHLVLCLLEGNF